MGLKDSLVNLMSDFTQMNKNPEFRSKTELSTIAGTSDAIPARGGRRHSLNITVGTAGPPPPDWMVRGRRQRTRSECPPPETSQLDNLSEKVPSEKTNDHKILEKDLRRHSAPIGISASQRIKLERIFSHIEETDEEGGYESDEPAFNQSITRIQISEGAENIAPKNKDDTKIKNDENGKCTNKCAKKCLK